MANESDTQLLQDAINQEWESDAGALECAMYTGNESEEEQRSKLIIKAQRGQQFFAYHEQIRPRVDAVTQHPLYDLQNMFKESGDDSSVYDNPQTQQLFKQLLGEFMGSAPFQNMLQIVKQMSIADGLPDDSQIAEILYNAWFVKFYRASAQSYSSGFEHVFVGEAQKGKGRGGQEGVNGLHSWVRYFYLDANYGRQDVEYAEFIKLTSDSELNSDPTPYVATFEFDLHLPDNEKELKPKGGFFLGTSPSFDFAVYCMCYLIDYATGRTKGTQGTKYHFLIDGWNVEFQLYYMPPKGGEHGHISSGFPIVKGSSQNQLNSPLN